jgi:mRNA interferase MazF
MKYYKDHRNWNQLKKILDEIDISIPFYEKEIWWVSFGVNIGIEIDGKGEDFCRPGVIIRKINKDHIWVVPVTSSARIKSGIHIPIIHNGLERKSFVITSQLQTISTKRLIARIGIVSEEQFRKIVITVRSILP